jgi:hypothetical protein
MKKPFELATPLLNNPSLQTALLQFEMETGTMFVGLTPIITTSLLTPFVSSAKPRKAGGRLPSRPAR